MHRSLKASPLEALTPQPEFPGLLPVFDDAPKPCLDERLDRRAFTRGDSARLREQRVRYIDRRFHAEQYSRMLLATFYRKWPR